MQARQPLDALGGETAVVDPDGVAGPLQGRVGLRRPRGPRLHQPRFGVQGRGLARPAQLRVGGVVAPEPLLSRALQPVVRPLANQQVTVRVGARAGVDRQGVGQLLLVGQMAGKAHRQLALLVGRQRGRQGYFHPLEQPAVGPLVQVGRVPVGGRVRVRPGRHVARCGVQ